MSPDCYKTGNRCDHKARFFNFLWLRMKQVLKQEHTKQEQDLINPKFPHNNVVHRGRDFAPHVVVSARVEEQVNVSLSEKKKNDTEVFQFSQCLSS